MGRGGRSSGGRSHTHRSSGGGHSFGGRSSSSRSRSSSSSHSSSSSYRRRYRYRYRNYGTSGHAGDGSRKRTLLGIASVMIIWMVMTVGIGIANNRSEDSLTDTFILNEERYTGYLPVDLEQSDTVREKIVPTEAFQRDCYLDELSWILEEEVLIEGMEVFYDKTGVQPYLYIADAIYGEKQPDSSAAEAFSRELYERMAGENEDCVLLMFIEGEPSVWSAWYNVGSGAQTVMDEEACDVLMDYVSELYTGDYTDEEFFGNVFSRTAEYIMD